MLETQASTFKMICAWSMDIRMDDGKNSKETIPCLNWQED